MHIDARARLEDAIRFHREGNLDEAERLYCAILDTLPNNPRLLYLLGNVFLQRKRWSLAIAVLTVAHTLEPLFGPVLTNLGAAYRECGKHDLAHALWRRAVDDGDFDEFPEERAEALANLGGIHVNGADPEAVIAMADAALAIDPDNASAIWNKALGLLEAGRWAEAWPLYDAGSLRAPDRRNRDFTGRGTPDWDGRSGGRLVVFGEQGIGDEIMFASILPDLIATPGLEVILECHPRLLGLMARSFPGVRCFGTRKDDHITWPVEHYGDPPAIDWKIPIGSLGRLYRPSAKACPGTPFLRADPERVRGMRARLSGFGTKPKVGLGWRGGAVKTRNDLRSVNLDALAPLIAAHRRDVTFISLQYTDEAIDEAAHLAWRHGLEVHHFPEVISAFDYDETAALVEALDLTILCNTTAMHVAGALGRECWSFTPRKCAWREGLTGPNPWYSSVRMVRAEGDDWAPVLARLQSDLGAWIEQRRLAA